MIFRKQTLDNGLQIVAEVNPNAYSMAAGFFVDTGSRDETDELSGVSHFLEHMAFKGTDRMSASDINRELDAIGSQSNAYTSEEQTVYYLAIVPDYQERAIALLAELMRPALRNEDFDVEKKVIVEEIHKYDDQPPYGAHERGLLAFYGSHALGRSVLGTKESVEALTPDQMRAYFQDRYSANNLSLVATGNVDFDALVTQVESLCGAWKSGVTRRTHETPPHEHENAWIERPTASQQYIIQIAAGPSAVDSGRYAHRLAANIFGDDSNSRLFWEFVDSGIADCASSSSYEFQETGITLTYLSCDPEMAESNLKRLKELQRDFQEQGATDVEMELAVSKVSSQIVRRAERPFNRLFSVGLNWLQRNEYRTVRDAIDAYQKVPLHEIGRAVEQNPLTHCTTVLAGPLKTNAFPI